MSGSDTLRLIDTESTALGTLPNSDLTAGLTRKAKMNNLMALPMPVPKKKMVRYIKAAIFVSVLSTVFVLVRVHFFEEDSFKIPFLSSSSSSSHRIQHVKLDLKKKTLLLTEGASGKTLKIKFVSDLLDSSPDEDKCDQLLQPEELEEEPDIEPKLKFLVNPFEYTKCFRWKHTMLIVNDTSKRGGICYTVTWQTTSEKSTPENCISLAGAKWYGGSLLANQQWPLEDNSFTMQPYVSSRMNIFQEKSGGSFGPVLERMWFNTLGFGIIADSDDPLHVSLDKGELCLKSQFQDSPYVQTDTDGIRPLSLKYSICMERIALQIHRTLMRNYVWLPPSGPDEYMMKIPMWSNRGLNMNSPSQAQVLAFQVDIKKHFFASGYESIMRLVLFIFITFVQLLLMVELCAIEIQITI
jgi:hypothetical protein